MCRPTRAPSPAHPARRPGLRRCLPQALRFMSAQAVEALRVLAGDLGARFLADVAARAQVHGALRPIAVPVRVVAGEHDEVGAEDIDDARQDRLLGLAGHPDVAGLEVLVRVALPAVWNPVAAFLEVLVHAVDEERHPADAGLEEGDA